MSLNKLIVVVVLFFNALALKASDENARVLVHSLSYIQGDYVNAVGGGKVLSEVEYGEMLEFASAVNEAYKEMLPTLLPSDTLQYGTKVRLLQQYILSKVSPDTVISIAGELKKQFIIVGKLTTAPSAYPDISKGAVIYNKECSRCHGDKGFGDGKDGLGADPAPRNFHDAERMRELSPFAVFNTVRLGIEGTLMKSHPTLTDKEVWDVSFYVLSLRYKEADKTALRQERVKLSDIASKSDGELRAEYELTDAEIANVRLQKPEEANHEFLKIASIHLTSALEAYRNADYKKAYSLAASAYLEGVEAVELPLKSANPELAAELEHKMMVVRQKIKSQAPIEEVELLVTDAQAVIISASKALDEKDYSFAMAFWMTVAILLREGLEAFLVIMAILAVLNKANLRHLKKFVHAAWIIAIGVGFIMWFLSGKLLQLGFARIEILEGIISISAVIMLLYIGFWLHGKSHADQWKSYVSGLVKSATGDGSVWGLVSITFFVVFREVFESVLFLSALNIESKGGQTTALGVGFLVAFAVVMVLAVITLKFSAKLPIQKLFRISAGMMSLLAVILMGKGVKAFQETGLVDIHALPLPEIEILGFYPTLETIGAQSITVATVFVLWRISDSKK